MTKTEEPYMIDGYDKDADVYVRLATIYSELSVAVSIADHIATLGLVRKNGDRYDWIEVVTQREDIRYYVVQCT